MMQSSVENFIKQICSLSRGLDETYRETIHYWEPEEPPVTVVFGDLGRRIATEFEAEGAAGNERIFALIEGALQGPENELATAVATGMLEALYGQAERTGSWEALRVLLGPQSQSHLAAWAGD